MVTVKFVVLLFFIVPCACYSKYCKICTNHILCQYSSPGPGVSCKEYDRSTFLTDDDIYELVNQINDRRNFIALGHSRHLPSAANMNKLVWSEELATFAQRWVDQCDPSLRPDKEDQCRNLEHTSVGQNIASIINPSSGFSVKSFVEMWFMQLLEYKDSVTYYNHFQDHDSKYFTQLIWAETKNVGCGRAKFNVNNVTIDRIVCNFSPRGNIQGKPLYIIGYPRTQCENQITQQETFKGLCTQKFAYKAKLPAPNLPVSSLLRILNLSNDSVKQEIDPIYNNMKQIIPHRNEMENPKHQIMRHIFGNKLQSKETDLSHPHPQNVWGNHVNISRNYRERFHNRDTEYSGLTHRYDHKLKKQPTVDHQMDDFRKYVKPTYPDDNYVDMNNFRKQCTRSTQMHNKDCESYPKSPPNQKNYQCTRGRITNWEMLQKTKMPITNTISNEFCPCSINTYTSFPSTITQRKYTLSCECINGSGVKIPCPNLLRTLEDNARNRNIALESELSFKDSYPNPETEYEWLFNKRRKHIGQNKRSPYIQNIRNRYKRDFGDSTAFKPFWQLDNFSNDGNPQLKALRYTTLHNRKKQKPKKYQTKSFTTESITIQFKNTNLKSVTEKYLSFDELLHLRKLNLSGNSARRKIEPEILRNPAEATTVATEATPERAPENPTEYTANTPFVRMRHCTRKLTCTWTGALATDSNGSVVPKQDQQGSRTPPGYVEGCTRTSTCTRDFMNRNKLPPSTSGSGNGDDDDDGDDDSNGSNDSDYCERRSLNFPKQNSRKRRSISKMRKKDVTEMAFIQDSYEKVTKDYKTLYDRLREKKSPIKKKCRSNDLSYGDLYYLVLSKIVKTWESKISHDGQCPCNRENERHCDTYITFLFCFIIFIFY